jgi:hypothetical protein
MCNGKVWKGSLGPVHYTTADISRFSTLLQNGKENDRRQLRDYQLLKDCTPQSYVQFVLINDVLKWHAPRQ